ncbi:MAG TPA: hypothetical protein VGZ73_22430 [Bryobacteraceae bacterium]|jgi:hypothetical protein|nr:hypothetical protein [Bryobacteraceae bacterium]
MRRLIASLALLLLFCFTAGAQQYYREYDLAFSDIKQGTLLALPAGIPTKGQCQGGVTAAGLADNGVGFTQAGLTIPPQASLPAPVGIINVQGRDCNGVVLYNVYFFITNPLVGPPPPQPKFYIKTKSAADGVRG